jgi:hypothetical protein
MSHVRQWFRTSCRCGQKVSLGVFTAKCWSEESRKPGRLVAPNPGDRTPALHWSLTGKGVLFERFGISKKTSGESASSGLGLQTAGVARSYDRNMGWTSPEARELFNQFLEYDAERRNRRLHQVTEALMVEPTTQEARDGLCMLGPKDAARALRQHPGYSLHRRIESVQTMLELFRRALADLSRAVASFPGLGTPGGRAARELIEHDVSALVNKELFAALGYIGISPDCSCR